MRTFDLSYWILFCPVCLLSVRGLLFSEGTLEVEVGAEKSGGRGKCGWYILYKRRIYFQLTKKKDTLL